MRVIGLLFSMLLLTSVSYSQNIFKGTILDFYTKELIAGAVISDGNHETISNQEGNFILASTKTLISISHIGYIKKEFVLDTAINIYLLMPEVNSLENVVVSANKTPEKRIEAPIAITSIRKKVIEETKAQKLDVLLNKVSGVFVPTLGNEQHQMSIRQPMSLKGLFLYLEDGLPIRATGVFSNNALIEMNMTALKQLEVIKGPSSALYGGEAIGGAINIITQSPPSIYSGKLSLQKNNTGYQKLDVQVGDRLGKFGYLVSGYYAKRKDGPLEHSDFNKTAITIRTDYAFNEKLKFSNALSYIDYYTDMPGPLDSINFSKKILSSLQTFTYRSVYALRNRSNLIMNWNDHSTTSVSYLYRNNSMYQNPTYLIASTKVATQFKGQVNDNAFSTQLFNVQHVQRFHWANSKLIIGSSIDYSPQNYIAKYIAITKDLTLNKYISYTAPSPDSLLRKYNTDIQNTATYIDYEFSPINRLKVVLAYRADFYKYDFVNQLAPSSSTGAPNTKTQFQKMAPKIGVTYNLDRLGFYGNYAEGFVPPQITELYNTSSVPYLLPQSFSSKEIGGWISIVPNRLYFDYSAYVMYGNNEIIAVKSPDGTTVNQNAGATKHMGIEYGIQFQPNKQWEFKVNGANVQHTYLQYVLSGVNYNGKTMSAAPSFQSNVETIWKPNSIKGLRLSYEWQHQSRYYMDDMNKYEYKGFDIHNVRIGYTISQHLEAWCNILNVFNEYYSVLATKTLNTGSTSYSYYLGEPREYTLGISYSFYRR